MIEVVGVVVCDVVTEVVTDVVGEVVWEVVTVVVGLVVGELVGVVVGVVTSHPWNPPWLYASVIAFNVAKIAEQLVVLVVRPVPTQYTKAGSPAGPLNSVSAPAKALAVSTHVATLFPPS